MKTIRPDSHAIMTSKQLEIFALQRAKTARDAIRIMGELAEKYGFLGSCENEGESLTVTGPKEAWLLKFVPPSQQWIPGGRRPGAYWVAQKFLMMVLITCNVARIRK